MANKPEDICVSLETARRLHEEGIVIESCFSWIREDMGAFELILYVINPEWHVKGIDYYPAPTAEEIYLPDNVKILDHDCRIEMWHNSEGYCCIGCIYYIQYEDEVIIEVKLNTKLCEAIAEMAIWLKQNVKVDKADN